MKRLLLFNSSNDLALASGMREYIAPKSVARMEKELASLPFWWSNDGDAIIVDNSKDALTAKAFFSGQGKEIFFTSPEEGYDALCKRSGNIYEPSPWGWSKAVADTYKRFGVPQHLLPNDNQLETMRQLSSREFAAKYIKRVLNEATKSGYDKIMVGEKMRFIKSLSQLKIEERTIFKSPWSSSGRGVFSADSINAPSIHEKLTGFIKRQGGFIADKLYNKHLDFALEFYIAKNKSVSFIGYSVFIAGDNGYYGHNLVASQKELREIIINNGCNPTLLDWLIESHIYLLREQLCDKYQGPLGIDLLIAEEDGSIKIHPCIEINLRMNMGILAINAYDKGCKNIALVPEQTKCFTAKIEEEKMLIGYKKC